MKTYSISQLARQFGLSRSTLLYYDRIGLLRAPERSAAGYRRYTQREYGRLERICAFRAAGVALAEVTQMLSETAAPTVKILRLRLHALGRQLMALRKQQRLILSMLEKMGACDGAPVMDKAMWVAMLQAAGMDEDAMGAWHAQFEALAPQAHHELLLSLGIAESEVRAIRNWSRNLKNNKSAFDRP